MKKYVFSKAAGADIDGIIETITEENPRAAEKWFDVLQEKCRSLAQFPRMGRLRDELRPGMHFFPYGEYLIFYRITDTAVIVVRIIHGARNLSDVFPSEGGAEA